MTTPSHRVALTFDLWDTLVVDDSDEPVRASRHLRTKAAQREHLFVDFATRRGADSDAALAAFQQANATFRHQWKVEHVTPHIGDRLMSGLRALGLPADAGFDTLVEAFSMMEVDIPPRLADGVPEMLEVLHERYRLGIISDAIVTPGAYLRRILAGYDLLRFFDITVFSDEAGAAKPDASVFHIAAKGLGVPVTGLVHVGDREPNDIAGPLAVGARAILYTGAVDRGSASTRASAVCTHHGELPDILSRLESP